MYINIIFCIVNTNWGEGVRFTVLLKYRNGKTHGGHPVCVGTINIFIHKLGCFTTKYVSKYLPPLLGSEETSCNFGNFYSYSIPKLTAYLSLWKYRDNCYSSNTSDQLYILYMHLNLNWV